MNISVKAKEAYLGGGMNCGEAVLSVLLDELYEDKATAARLVKAAGAFGGGLNSGCLCGAVAAAAMAIGLMTDSPAEKRAKVAKLVALFKEQYKVTCCRALTRGYEHADPNRKEKCSAYVMAATELADKLIKG